MVLIWIITKAKFIFAPYSIPMILMTVLNITKNTIANHIGIVEQRLFTKRPANAIMNAGTKA